METQTNDNFTFYWTIENFSMCHQSLDESVSSTSFTLTALPGMKWYIKLYPQGCFGFEDYICISFCRFDDVPEKCRIKFNVQALTCNEILICSSPEWSNVFLNNDYWMFFRFIERHRLFRSLVMDTLTLKCTLKPIYDIYTQDVLPPLSYENGLFSDVMLRAGDTIFKAHNAILLSKWPELVKELHEKETHEKDFDIGSNVLENMLRYIYTGKTAFIGHESFEELSAAATKYGLPALSSMPVVSEKCRTQISAEKISFEWPIKNFSRLPINAILHNVFIVKSLEHSKWKLKLHIRKTEENATVFDISIFRPNDLHSKLIFLKSKISINATNSSESTHLFENDESWKCAEFSGNISTNPISLMLKCEFKFSDCTHSSVTLESSCAFPSSISCLYFNHSLRNLYDSKTLSDVSIVVGSKTLYAHKFILCARSSVFSKIFETAEKSWRKSKIEIPDVDPDVMDEMLGYMYCGYLKKPLKETAVLLYAAANKYNVSSLKARCSSFLKCNLSAKNVCEVLQLAHMHSDDDLYQFALEYISEHAEHIFSTDEWKEVSKANLYARGLENLMTRNKMTK